MGLATDIKAQIKARLDELVVSQVLAEVQEDDYKQSVLLDIDFGGYPAAILSGPSIESEVLTNTQNVRTYIFEIIVVTKAESIASVSDIEDLVDAILNKFDTDFNLHDTAVGGVAPAVSTPQPVTSRAGQLIVFSVVLRARGVVNVL